MASLTGRQVRKPETGVRIPAEASGFPSEVEGFAGLVGSDSVASVPNTVPEKSASPLLNAGAAFTLNAIKANLLAGFTPEQVEAIRARFDAKVSPCPLTGCFHWDAATSKEGYAVFSLALPGSKPSDSTTRRIVFAHRLAWELANGPIPPGLTLDHTCESKCVNPAHFEPVTNRVNILRRDLRRIEKARRAAFARVAAAAKVAGIEVFA